MFTVPATRRVSSCVFAAAAKSITEGSPLTPCRRWMPSRDRGQHAQRVLGILDERLHLRVARAGLREDGLGGIDEVAGRGVVDAAVRDGHRRHHHEPGTNTAMAAWMPKRPEKATQAISVSFWDRTGFEV